MAEIGVRVIFENFIYKFGEKMYRQGSGGPIGARVTMAASRLVMIDWGEHYENVKIKDGDKIAIWICG